MTTPSFDTIDPDSEWTKIDLAAIEARAARAPLGPWATDNGRVTAQGSTVIGDTLAKYADPRTHAVVDFVAEARTDVPALLALVDELAGALNNHLDGTCSRQSLEGHDALLKHIKRRRQE